MPNSGLPVPNIFFVVSTAQGIAAGSPGPFDKKYPSGFHLLNSSKLVSAGKTLTKQFRAARFLSIFFLIPKSSAAILYLALGSPTSYGSLVVTLLESSSPAILGNAANSFRNLSRSLDSDEIRQFIAPLSLIFFTSALVSTPVIPTRPLRSRYD